MEWLEGKPIAEHIKERLKKEIATLKRKPRLAIVWVGEDKTIEQFIQLKEAFAREVGIETKVYRFPTDIAGNALRKKLSAIVHAAANTAVIPQLPLPPHINPDTILDAVMFSKDADGLSSGFMGKWLAGKTLFLPPVAGAVEALLEHYQVSVQDKRVVLVGWGRLVGKPLTIWFVRKGAGVCIIDRDSALLRQSLLPSADIIVSGVGKPHLITGELIKEGAVVIDAGTSEGEGGEIVGDVDIESVGKKAAYLTPKKGGIGPLTIAMLMQNVVTLARVNSKRYPNLK